MQAGQTRCRHQSIAGRLIVIVGCGHRPPNTSFKGADFAAPLIQALGPPRADSFAHAAFRSGGTPHDCDDPSFISRRGAISTAMLPHQPCLGQFHHHGSRAGRTRFGAARLRGSTDGRTSLCKRLVGGKPIIGLQRRASNSFRSSLRSVIQELGIEMMATYSSVLLAASLPAGRNSGAIGGPNS